MTAKLARWCATFAFVAAIAAAVRILTLFPARTGTSLGPQFEWLVVPLVCPVVAHMAMRTGRFATIWTAVGTMLAFVVLAAWSFGLFFFPAAGLLLLGGIVHTASLRASWRLATIPFWILFGASGLGSLFWSVHEVVARLNGGRNVEAEILVWGGELFATLSTLLLTRWLWRRWHEATRPVAVSMS